MGDWQKGVYAFDVDGVLTNTARSHAIFCNDLNKEFKFGLPQLNQDDNEAVKRILANPMSALLRAYGFPDKEIQKLDRLYAERFSIDPKYSSKPFPGVEKMLKTLKKTGRHLMILSSNTRKNIIRDLGKINFGKFDQHLTREDLQKYHSGNKGYALHFYIRAAFDNMPSQAVVYSGDMLSDFEAANMAGARFRGVSYGWGRWQKGEKRFPIAETVEELTEILIDSFPD